MLNSKDFTTALEIIPKYHSTELAINNLVKEGFILRVGPEGLLEVEKI